MTIEQKGELTWKIVHEMKNQAILQNKKPFDAGDMFFSLIFKSDEELNKIASLLRIA